MKKRYLMLIAVVVLMVGCGQKKPAAVIQTGTPPSSVDDGHVQIEEPVEETINPEFSVPQK